MQLSNHILSTKILRTEVANRIREAGMEPHMFDFIRTVETADNQVRSAVLALSDTPAIAVFTSPRAVRIVHNMLGERAPAWSMACIREATLHEVSSAWPNNEIAATGGNGEDLANQLVQLRPPIRLLYFCGNSRHSRLPDRLKEAGIPFREFVLYATESVAIHVPNSYDAILFFSPSAVQSFFAMNSVSDTVPLFATGPTTAAEIRRVAGRKPQVAAGPGQEAMADALIGYFCSPV